MAIELQSTLIHLGKAGGGTVLDRAEKLGYTFGGGSSNSKRQPKQYHGSPPPNHISKYKRLQNLILTLRDPIDRYKSNYYWIQQLTCRNNDDVDYNDTRDPNCKYGMYGRPFECCKVNTALTTKFWNRYNNSASILAESFCSSSSSATTDSDINTQIQIQKQKQARIDLQKLKHIKFSIHNWLFEFDRKKLLSNNNINDKINNTDWMDEKLFGVVVEKGYDFIEQIDGAIEWILSKTKYKKYTSSSTSTTSINNRNNYTGTINTMAEEMAYHDIVKAKKRLEQQPQQPQQHSLQHSSIISNSTLLLFPWLSRSDEPITVLGTCCLMKYYYYEDYKLLTDPIFINKVCKGRTKELCSHSIQSINDRRKQILQHITNGGLCIDYYHKNSEIENSEIEIDASTDTNTNTLSNNNNNNGTTKLLLSSKTIMTTVPLPSLFLSSILFGLFLILVIIGRKKIFKC